MEVRTLQQNRYSLIMSSRQTSHKVLHRYHNNDRENVLYGVTKHVMPSLVANKSFPLGGLSLKNCAQRGARTHDPEIKSLMLYRLS